MKIPPLKEMEPLPPVPELPTCSHIDATADAEDEICELSSDSDDGDGDMPEGAWLASEETGSFLDMDLPKVCSIWFTIHDHICILVNFLRIRIFLCNQKG